MSVITTAPRPSTAHPSACYNVKGLRGFFTIEWAMKRLHPPGGQPHGQLKLEVRN